MAFQFSEAANFKPGMLFLGRDEHGLEKGIATERHALTIAGSGSGKGAAQIIPNLLRWPHSVCVVDPKGENAEHTWQAREAMGQLVGVVDPFHVANVPDRLRVSINPLAMVDPSSLTTRADIEVIADGLVKRSDPKHTEWDDGAASIIAGVIAFVIAEAPPEHRTLTAVRKVLLQPNDALFQDAQRMMACEACGGLAKSAGLTIATGIEAAKGMEKDFLSGARRHSQWIDDPAHAAVLGSSTFDLDTLKTGRASLFLVIPPQYLDTQGVFLRLFVRSALNAMAKGNRQAGKCLFLLDEFFSLGRLDIVAKAAGLMRSYGVQLWVFLQDLGQLTSLYRDDAGTFFSNSDAHIFFGNTDADSLIHISARLGQFTAADLTSSPPQKQNLIWPTPDDIRRQAMQHDNAMAKHNYTMSMRGSPRLPPDTIRELISKRDEDTVAQNMIVFAKGKNIYRLRLAPYFQPAPKPEEPKPIKYRTPYRVMFFKFAALCGIAASFIVWFSHLGEKSQGFGQYFSELLFYTAGLIIIGISLVLVVLQKEQEGHT